MKEAIQRRAAVAGLFLLAALLWLSCIPSALALQSSLLAASSVPEWSNTTDRQGSDACTTSPLKNRVMGSVENPSGRLLSEEEPSPVIAAGSNDYASGRREWLNRDPLGEAGGINLYQFVGNDPINRVDPYGLDWGDWWDPRTWFNSGFTESWSDSANSIGQGLGGALAGNWDDVADAYDSGVLGQTKDAGPVTKYGTRGCLAIGTAAAVTAGGLIAADAAGISNIGRTRLGWKGGEITFIRPGKPTPDFRINPFGGSGYPPHYHRRPGIGKHRPWDGGW